MRPSGETKLAEQPPSHTIAPSGNSVGLVRAAGSIVKPTFFSVSACAASCDGIHMPPGFSQTGGGGSGRCATDDSGDAVGEVCAVSGSSGRSGVEVAGEQ